MPSLLAADSFTVAESFARRSVTVAPSAAFSDFKTLPVTRPFFCAVAVERSAKSARNRMEIFIKQIFEQTMLTNVVSDVFETSIFLVKAKSGQVNRVFVLKTLWLMA